MGSFTATAFSHIAISQCFSRMVQASVYTGRKDVSRERYRQANIPRLDEKDSIMYVNRSQVKGTLLENIHTLTQRAKETKDE